MLNDSRSRRVILLAHCLLNQNSIVAGLARRKAMVRELLGLLDELGLGVIQLPCPEILCCGLRRWWMTKEQYDNPGFRRLCRRLSKIIVDYLVEYRRNGIEVTGLIGVAGSPSCGVHTTSTGWFGGNPRSASSSRRTSGRGVFMEVLLSVLEEHGVKPKVLLEYDYEDPENSFKEIKSILGKLLVDK